MAVLYPSDDQTPGGAVPIAASPSGGKAVDDVPARLTPGEFVVPKDVVAWKGEEHFQKLIQKSREDRPQAPAQPEVKAADMEPHQKAFLNAVASGESPGGAYNARYNGDTPATFASYDAHPNVPVPGSEGLSTAAGRYMFTKSTWDDYGGGKIDPATQDKRAWQLAVDRYKDTTGGDLNKELQANGFTPDIAKALSPTWTSFRNPTNAIATYNDSYGRYTQPQDTASAVPADVPLPPPRPADLPQQTSAIPLDPYNTEAVFAARGGLVPALPVKSYADGGAVDDEEDQTDPTSYVSLVNQDTGGSGAASPAPQRTSIVPAAFANLPFSGVPDILHDGLTYMQNHFNLSDSPSALPSDGQRRFASGEDAADPADVKATDKALGLPDGMDEGLKNVARLSGTYEYYQNRGEYEKASRVAASLMLRAQRVAEEYGGAALKASDPVSAAKIVAAGHNATIPGQHAEVDDNGNYTITDLASGKVTAAGKMSPADVLATANGMKNGTAYWREIARAAGKKAGASDNDAQSASIASEIAKTMSPGAVPITPTPAGTPAAPPVTPAAATTPTPSENTADGPVIEGRTAGTKPPAAVTAGAATSMSPNLVDELEKRSPDVAAKYRLLQVSNPRLAEIMQREYQNRVMMQAAQQPQASAQKKPNELHQIESNVNTAWNDYGLKDSEGKELAPKEVQGIKRIARHLAGNGVYAADAVDYASKMTSVDPKANIPVDDKGRVNLDKVPASVLPFQMQKRDDGIYATFPDGSPPVKLNQEAYLSLRPILQRKLQAVVDAQKGAKDTLGAKVSSGVSQLGQAAQDALPAVTREQLIEQRRRMPRPNLFGGYTPNPGP
jgi:muramidase (phage lysozyme)